MADIVILDPNKPAQYLKSVNTSDYTVSSTVLVNPDVSAVVSVDQKYWKKGTGNTVIEMTLGEKQAVDDADLVLRKNTADNFASSLPYIFTALVKVINIRLPAGQKITKQELIDAIKLEIT